MSGARRSCGSQDIAAESLDAVVLRMSWASRKSRRDSLHCFSLLKSDGIFFSPDAPLSGGQDATGNGGRKRYIPRYAGNRINTCICSASLPLTTPLPRVGRMCQFRTAIFRVLRYGSGWAGRNTLTVFFRRTSGRREWSPALVAGSLWLCWILDKRFNSCTPAMYNARRIPQLASRIMTFWTSWWSRLMLLRFRSARSKRWKSGWRKRGPGSRHRSGRARYVGALSRATAQVPLLLPAWRKTGSSP